MFALTVRKGQVSLELLPFVGLSLLLLMVFVALIAQRAAFVHQESAYSEAESVVHRLNQEIRVAFSVTDGYARRFELPQTLNGKQYNISVVRSATIVASVEEQETTLPTLNVTGQPVKGWNRIRKQNGIIILN